LPDSGIYLSENQSTGFMNFKQFFHAVNTDRFSILVFIRIIFLLVACVLFGFLFARTEYIFSQIILFSVIIILTIELIHFTRKTSRDLSRFLFAVKHGDISINFSSEKLGPGFHDLADAFREVIRTIKETKIEKEAQFQLLQAIVDKIGFGIIACDDQGDIHLMNHSAGKLLGIPKSIHWAHIEKSAPLFTKEVTILGDNGRILVELRRPEEKVQLSISKNFVNIAGKNCSVITFYDIRDEIEQKEIEAWYKLIRVLTHEIMNSVTPLSSLTDTMLMLLEDSAGKLKPIARVSDTTISDIRSSVKTIQSRSRGILQFVEAYRKLTDIPHPDPVILQAADIIHSAIDLMKPELQKRKIDYEILVHPENMRLKADRILLEQVLINLITNSIHALDNTTHPLIKIKAEINDSRINISVSDNGRGIDPEKIDKIFIPFYSTREGGSGIGLSFSKQVIHQHFGRIRVLSTLGKGATFTLELPKPADERVYT
jgi:two-component system nitrogen regulation sensor histidine kinase NtrY